MGSKASASYRTIKATDDKGRPAIQDSGVVAIGSLVYLWPPSPDAKSINVRLSINEVVSGPQGSLVFLNVAASPHPKLATSD